MSHTCDLVSVKLAIAMETLRQALTNYKATMLKVREYVKSNPNSTVKEIINSVGIGHYANEKSARNAIKNALENWEKDWCVTNWSTNKGSWVYSSQGSKEERRGKQ